MKKQNIALIILMALGISACGSSGGNNESAVAVNPSNQTVPEQPVVPEQPTTPTQPVAPDQPTTPTQPVAPYQPTTPISQPQKETPYTNTSALVGGGFIIPMTSDKNIQVAHLTGKSEGAFNYLTVDGKNVAIIPEGFTSNSVAINSANSKHYAYKGNYTLSGFVWDEGMENQYLITQGIAATKDIPISGSATYRGNGISVYSSTNTGAVETITQNDVVLTANFGSKQLGGEITSKNDSAFKPVTIQADITGNTFYSDANGIKVQGGFFGDNAKELAGDYIRTSEQNAIGVFIATKE